MMEAKRVSVTPTPPPDRILLDMSLEEAKMLFELGNFNMTIARAYEDRVRQESGSGSWSLHSL
jgi:hypothetical protein